jgi:hypothetical protein
MSPERALTLVGNLLDRNFATPSLPNRSATFASESDSAYAFGRLTARVMMPLASSYDSSTPAWWSPMGTSVPTVHQLLKSVMSYLVRASSSQAGVRRIELYLGRASTSAVHAHRHERTAGSSRLSTAEALPCRGEGALRRPSSAHFRREGSRQRGAAGAPAHQPDQHTGHRSQSRPPEQSPTRVHVPAQVENPLASTAARTRAK